MEEYDENECCVIKSEASRVRTVYREALYLIYFEDMSYQEAGEVLHKSVKQITNIVYRGKQNLRGLLEKEGISDAKP